MPLSLSDLIGAYKEEAPTAAAAAPEEPSTGRKGINKQKPRRDDGYTNADESSKNRKRKRPERRKSNEEEGKINTEDGEEEEVELKIEDLLKQEDDNYFLADRTSGMEHDEFYHNYDDTVRALFQQEGSGRQKSQPQNQTERQQQQALIDRALYPVRKSDTKKQRSKTASLGVDGSETRYSDSVAGRYQSRRKRTKIKVPTNESSATGAGRPSKDDQFRMETAQEVEARVEKLESTMERSKRIQMYKKRTVNFQEEEDVGNAFAERANLYLAEQLRREKKARIQNEAQEKRRKANERHKQELDEAKERERIDLLEEDDSVREQSQLLAQLSQSTNVISSSQPDEANSDVGEVASPIKDYWQQGYTIPRPEDIGFKYNPTMKEIVEQTSVDVTSSDDDIDEDSEQKSEAKATYPQLMNQPYSYGTEQLYFPPNRINIKNPNGRTIRAGYTLTNALQFLAMASRSLCGMASDDAGLENRYIRLLCSHTHGKKNGKEVVTLADYHLPHYVRIMSEEQGQNMYLYLRHTWNDSADVATMLGLIDRGDETPVTGGLLARMHSNWTETRKRCMSLKRGSREWSYESAPDRDREKELAGAEDESLRTASTVPDGVTSKGVLDVVTHISASAAAIIDRKLISRLSYEARGALAGATCLYSHVQGTIPPLPHFPLDPTAVIFGPVDKHSSYFHSSVQMYNSTFKIILSKLMARVAKSRLSKDRSAVAKDQLGVSKFVAEYAVVNKNDFYKLYTQQFDLPDFDIPLVELYRGMSQFCSFTANGCASQNNKLFQLEDRESLKTKDIEADDDEGDNVDSLYSSLLLQESGMKEVAERIWSCCQEHVNHNGLLRFPKLRITSAIALVCRSIPPSAAEILSRPLGDSVDSTPIHLFKRCLEHMEEKKMISDSIDYFDENAVRAAEIEYIIHDASEMFQDAVKVNPTDVDYHLWHIGCLSACLLISSGNRIASGSHLYPSQKRDSIEFRQGPSHEVRVKLKKFSEVRLEVSMAVKALVTLARYQKSAKSQFAVCAVLGWSQVMGLLVGSAMNDFQDDIQNLYSFHARQWIKQDTSSVARDIWKKQSDTVDDAEICARNVENNPDDILNWRNLVRCLGPVCTERSASTREGWWGSGRRWWQDSILSIMIPTRILTKRETGTAAGVLDRLKRCNDGAIHSSQSKSSIVDVSADEMRFHNRWMDWLPTKADTQIQEEEHENVSDEVRSICNSSLLPSMIPTDFEGLASLDLRLAWLSNDDLPHLSSTLKEINAYKVLLRCHLLSAEHSNVEEFIFRSFILPCWKSASRKIMKAQCDELTILRWLRAMGLDLDMILEGRIQKNRQTIYTIVDSNTRSEAEQPEPEPEQPQPTRTEQAVAAAVAAEPEPEALSPSANNRRRQKRQTVSAPVPARIPRATRSDSVEFWASLNVPPVSSVNPSIHVASSTAAKENESRQRRLPSSIENDSRRHRISTIENGERRERATIDNKERQQRRPPSRTDNDSRRERRPPIEENNVFQQQHEYSTSTGKRRRVEQTEGQQRKRSATPASSTGLYDLLQSHCVQCESNTKDEFDVLNKKIAETIDLSDD